MDKILVSRRIPQPALDLLDSLADMQVSPHDRLLLPEELLSMSQGCRALLCMAGDRIDRGLLESLPELEMVANYAVGVDNIDLEAARDLEVMITNTPDVLTAATADMTIALILAVMRRLVEGDRLIRNGGFHGVQPFFMLGTEAEGKTLGIYGMGRIGLAVARRARCFGFKLIYHNRNRRPAAELELAAEYVTYEDLLARSDVISINAPLDHHTKGAFDYAAFRDMKPTAYLVNTGRGPIVKEQDLIRALEEGLIAGSALDVYEFEPKVHPRLISMDNVVLSPHLGSATRETREKMALTAAANIQALLMGQNPPNRVV